MFGWLWTGIANKFSVVRPSFSQSFGWGKQAFLGAFLPMPFGACMLMVSAERCLGYMGTNKEAEGTHCRVVFKFRSS